MTCLACGSENKPENRFCGLCGVAVTGNQPAATTCASCGNTNEPTYSFCGKCGAKIERREPAKVGSANAIAHENLRTVDLAASSPRGTSPKLAEKPQAPSGAMPSRAGQGNSLDRNQDGSTYAMPDSKRKTVPTTIGGPSFLGLSSDSENSEYLFEDEGHSASGLRILLVILLLAGIAGAILLQVRSRHATPKPPELARPSSASAPVPQGENQLPATQRDAKNDTSSAAPVNNADAEQHPDHAEAREEENKAASAPKPSVDTPAKEPGSKEPSSKDNQTADSEV